MTWPARVRHRESGLVVEARLCETCTDDEFRHAYYVDDIGECYLDWRDWEPLNWPAYALWAGTR